MLGAFRSAFATPDLRRKILFTLGIVAVYRVGATLPSPGVSYVNIQECIKQVEGGDNQSIYSLINLFSGGALLQLFQWGRRNAIAVPQSRLLRRIEHRRRITDVLKIHPVLAIVAVALLKP